MVKSAIGPIRAMALALAVALPVLALGGCAAANPPLNLANARLTVVAFRDGVAVKFKTVPVDSRARKLIEKLRAMKHGWHRDAHPVVPRFLFQGNSFQVAVLKGMIAVNYSPQHGTHGQLVHALAPNAYRAIASAVAAIPKMVPGANLPQTSEDGEPLLRYIPPETLWTAVACTQIAHHTLMLAGGSDGLELFQLKGADIGGKLGLTLLKHDHFAMGYATAMSTGPSGKSVLVAFGGGWLFRVSIPSLKVLWYRKLYWRGGGCLGMFFPPGGKRVLAVGFSGIPWYQKPQEKPHGSIYLLSMATGATIRHFGQFDGGMYTDVAGFRGDTVIVRRLPARNAGTTSRLAAFNYRSGEAVLGPRIEKSPGFDVASFARIGPGHLAFVGRVGARSIIGVLPLSNKFPIKPRFKLAGGRQNFLLGATICVSVNGRVLAAPGAKGQITFWDTHNLRKIGNLQLEPLGKGGLSLCFTPDGRFLVGLFNENGAIFVWPVPAAVRRLVAAPRH